jgi:hypothetical protein
MIDLRVTNAGIYAAAGATPSCAHGPINLVEDLLNPSFDNAGAGGWNTETVMKIRAWIVRSFTAHMAPIRRVTFIFDSEWPSMLIAEMGRLATARFSAICEAMDDTICAAQNSHNSPLVDVLSLYVMTRDDALLAGGAYCSSESAVSSTTTVEPQPHGCKGKMQQAECTRHEECQWSGIWKTCVRAALPDPCSQFKCGAECGGETCGWNSVANKCVTGAVTDATEHTAGDCSANEGASGGKGDTTPAPAAKDTTAAAAGAGAGAGAGAAQMCSNIRCSSQCVGECGWSNGRCLFGARTDYVELSAQLGDCGSGSDNAGGNKNAHDAANSSDTSGDDGSRGAKSSINVWMAVLVLVLVLTICVALYVQYVHKNDARHARLLRVHARGPRRDSDEESIIENAAFGYANLPAAEGMPPSYSETVAPHRSADDARAFLEFQRQWQQPDTAPHRMLAPAVAMVAVSGAHPPHARDDAIEHHSLGNVGNDAELVRAEAEGSHHQPLYECTDDTVC